MNAKLLGIIAGCLSITSLYGQQDWQLQSVPIQSRWAKEVSADNALPEYPRPQMQRKEWQNLNGLWEYAITGKAAPQPATFNGRILVPYPLESALSGVKKSLQPTQALWYRKAVNITRKQGQVTMLNFGAVDNETTVFVNGKEVGHHQGGYTAFSFDISASLRDGDNEIIVKVLDPTEQGTYPHGKQVLNPQNIYYTPSSGIWQTVWLEQLPSTHIESIRLTPDIDQQRLNIAAVVTGDVSGYSIQAEAFKGSEKVALAKLPLKGGALKLPSPRLWSPEDPFLYQLKLTLLKDNKIIDEVQSYAGMRKVAIAKDGKGFDRIFLNNKYIYNLGTLDQGFWPDGLMTAPTDEALAFDIKAIKAMGFNTIRKHIKIEPQRWYYHADKEGILVWQDFVNPNQGLPEGAKEAFEKQATETMEQLYDHPSIICWVLFNEQWGSFDQARLTEWVKKADPGRLVNGHSGDYIYIDGKVRKQAKENWPHSDMVDVHSYPDPMNAPAMAGKARILGEYGGIGTFIPGHQWSPSSGWGYIQVTPASLKNKYTIMMQNLRMLEKEGLAGSIYTQPFDVEGEENGLITYDREVIKVPFEQMRKINGTLSGLKTFPDEVTAADADLSDPLEKYSTMLEAYVGGQREPQFLRELSAAAAQAGDKAGLARISKDYIASLKPPYNEEQLSFILQNTNAVSDPGFGVLQSQLQDSSAYLKPREVTVKMMNTIFNDLMAPSLAEGAGEVNWDSLEQRVKPYGKPADEIFLRAKTIYFYNKQDWQQYAPVATVYLEKYGQNIPKNERETFQTAVANATKNSN